MTRGNMSPLNRGSLLGPRIPPVGLRPPRFGAIFPPGMPPRMPLPPMSGIHGLMRPRLPPPPRIGGQPGGPRPLLPPGRAPLPPPMGGPRGPLMCPWPRRILPPQMVPHMRPRFPPRNGSNKGKPVKSAKKVAKLEELELKKPWMTDEIRSEIQKKNKLYAKAKKNKDAKEWGEFKDVRNKVTRMIRDAKNDYLTKHPEQACFETNMETKEPNNESYDTTDENNQNIEVNKKYYCEVCDKEYNKEEKLAEHMTTHRVCGIDGCTFSANNLLVDKHIKMQHHTGLYDKVKNVSTPEEIEKWIKDRKRKYPTKARIEEKKKMELEKTEESDEINRQFNNKRIHSRRNNHQQRNINTVKKQKNKWRVPKEQTTLPDVETYRGLIEFPGTSCLEDNFNKNENDNEVNLETKCINEAEEIENAFNISDEEDVLMDNNQTTTNPIQNTLMYSLVADYGSEDDDGPEEIPIKKLANHSNDINIMEDKLLNSEQNSIKNRNTSTNDTKSNSSEKSVGYNRKMKKENKPLGIKDRVISKPKINRNNRSLNLLEKLFAAHIKHERSQIYQCVKYIASNNFFAIKS